MGEKPAEVVIASISAPAARALTKAVAAALKQAPATPPPAPADDEPQAIPASLDPWTRTAPDDSHTHNPGALLVAFLNADARVMWIGAARVAEVPAGWRPLLVGPPVLPKSERLS